MQKPPLVIYWARRDFRLADNPALAAAVDHSVTTNTPLLPLFVVEDYMISGDPTFQFGYPSRHFLAEALPRYASNFPEFAIVRGKGAGYLISLADTYDLTIFVNDDVYGDFYKQIVKLQQCNVRVTVLEDALSISKDTRTGEGRLYSVFTPFKKSVWAKFVAISPQAMPRLDQVQFAHDVAAILPSRVENASMAIRGHFSSARSIKVGSHTIDLDTLIAVPDLTAWYYDETAAVSHFKEYLTSGNVDSYDVGRDSLELDATTEWGRTSKMSVALAWGLVSSRTLMSMLRDHFDEPFDNPFSNRVSQGALIYISELIWREFYRYQFFHHPELMHTEFQERFRGTVAWVDDVVALERFTAWIKGETGYPIVDAAMKQLSATGWMHNRSRMIVASILTKNLGVDWRWGQEYFRATLIDLDEASNNGGWQWGASVGADPKPIRIFNPELQAKNYDTSGAYQDRWLGGGSFMRTERVPIVPHKDARDAALKRYGLEKEVPRDY